MPADSNKVTTRTVVITGSTRGLGLEMARVFAARGWQVAGCGRSADGVSSVADELGGDHLFSITDVADDAAVAVFAKKVLSALGPPDLLLNNAALMNQPAALWEVSAREFDDMTAVNINGTANLVRHFAPAMIGAGRGVIVNFSSGWGRSSSAEVAPYCATKWAIEGMTEALAQDLPRGVAAVALNPGVIDTDMLRQCWGKGAAGYELAADWASRAVPFLEKLGPRDNGAKLTAP